MTIEQEIYGKVCEINDLLDRLNFERSWSDGSTEVKPKDYFLLERDFDFIKYFKKLKDEKNENN